MDKCPKYPYQNMCTPCLGAENCFIGMRNPNKSDKGLEPPKTHADLIRAMSDEELAIWLMTEAPKLISAPVWCKSGCEDEDDCTHERDCVKNWLAQLAEED